MRRYLVVLVVLLVGCGGQTLVRKTQDEGEKVAASAEALLDETKAHLAACQQRKQPEATQEAKSIEAGLVDHIAHLRTYREHMRELIDALVAKVAELEEQAGPAAKWKFIAVLAVPLLALAAAVYLDFRLKMRWLSGVVLGLGILMGAGLAWAFYKSYIISGGILILLVAVGFVVVSVLTKQEWLTKHIVGAVEKGRAVLEGPVKDEFNSAVSESMDATAKGKVREIKES